MDWSDWEWGEETAWRADSTPDGRKAAASEEENKENTSPNLKRSAPPAENLREAEKGKGMNQEQVS